MFVLRLSIIIVMFTKSLASVVSNEIISTTSKLFNSSIMEPHRKTEKQQLVLNEKSLNNKTKPDTSITHPNTFNVFSIASSSSIKPYTLGESNFTTTIATSKVLKQETKSIANISTKQEKFTESTTTTYLRSKIQLTNTKYTNGLTPELFDLLKIDELDTNNQFNVPFPRLDKSFDSNNSDFYSESLSSKDLINEKTRLINFLNAIAENDDVLNKMPELAKNIIPFTSKESTSIDFSILERNPKNRSSKKRSFLRRTNRRSEENDNVVPFYENTNYISNFKGDIPLHITSGKKARHKPLLFTFNDLENAEENSLNSFHLPENYRNANYDAEQLRNFLPPIFHYPIRSICSPTIFKFRGINPSCHYKTELMNDYEQRKSDDDTEQPIIPDSLLEKEINDFVDSLFKKSSSPFFNREKEKSFTRTGTRACGNQKMGDLYDYESISTGPQFATYPHLHKKFYVVEHALNNKQREMRLSPNLPFSLIQNRHASMFNDTNMIQQS